MTKNKSMIIIILGYLLMIGIGILTFILIKDKFTLLVSMLIVDVVMTLIIFVFSIVTNNSSFYDPYWSVVPPFILIIWIIMIDVSNLYSYVILFGIVFWSLRLTRNWYLNFKGFGYEDFRYQDFRKQFKKFYWLISFIGIHLFPTLIVYLALYPLYYVLNHDIINPGYIYLGVLIIIVGAIISYYADKELITHKLNKREYSVKTGIWKYSRHPNYLGELTNWFGVFIVSLSIGVRPELGIGFLAMLMLFELYSIPKMEKKLLGNKTDYQEIINSVPRLLPMKLLFNSFKSYNVKQEGKDE